MRIVMLEPLGVEEAYLHEMVDSFIQKGHEFILFNTRPADKSELAARCHDADAVILANHPLPADIIRTCPRLKMISVAFTGVDHVGIDACKEAGIRVSNAAGYSTHSVAELAFGMMIAVLRNTLPCDAATRNGKTKDGLVGHELFGKTLGIIGTGAIGLRVAEIGRAFGCKLLAYSRTHRDMADSLGIHYVPLATLMSESDIVSLHLPLNEQTRGIINEDLLSRMKPAAVLINTARGSVVDNAALARALTENRIAGAGIDVFETEPPIAPNHPLFHAPRVVLAPHVGFATEEALVKRARIAFDNVEAWLDGSSQNIVV